MAIYRGNNLISGTPVNIPQATENTIGGIKASEKTTTETQEVKIDTATGKLYVAPSSSLTPDNSTITETNNVITTVAVTDQNTGIKKFWSGTKAEYDAIATKDANTLYNVKGDNEAVAYNAYTKSETDSLITTAISTMLSSVYPVGSIYIGTASTCPMATLIANSTWELVGSDKVLQGAGTRGTVGTTIDEKLPTHTHNATTGGISANHQHDRGNMEITGYLGSANQGAASATTGGFLQASGAFWLSGQTTNTFAQGSTFTRYREAYFNASNTWSGATGYVSSDHTHSLTTGAPSDATYQSSAHVQPDAYLVNIWKRTA